MTNSSTLAPTSDAYYVNLFVENPAWSTPGPNEDEFARWAKISNLLEKIATVSPPPKRLRILDVGCGRGWLTNLASGFGESEGVEPVAAVAAQAGRMFPELRFTAGTAETILAAPDFHPYDVVLTSEVIEHVPREAQPDFVRNLGRLLKPGGHVILTTPRGESLQEWTRLSGDPSQPVEDWLYEPELRQLFTNENFAVIGHERVLFDLKARRHLTGEAEDNHDLVAIYQVWVFQLPEAHAPAPFQPFVAPETVLSGFHETVYGAADHALKLLPDHPALLTARASALLELGHPEAARKLLIWVVALHANYAPARRILAETLCRLGLTRDAESQLMRAAQLEDTARGVAKSFSFLDHLREAKMLEGGPSQLETRTAAINRHTAPCIYLHPPAKLRFEVPLNTAGRFTCAIAMQPETWDKPTAGACEFSLRVNGREVFRKAINPKQVPAQRCWHEVDIDVPASSAAFHEFVFRTLAIGHPPEYRWALWREPVFRSQTVPAA